MVLVALIILWAPVPVITTADLFMEFAIPPLKRLMAMDLLQLTVLALHLVKRTRQNYDKLPGALSPLFDSIVFLFVYFILMIFISPPDVWGVTNSCLYAVGEYVFSSV